MFIYLIEVIKQTALPAEPRWTRRKQARPAEILDAALKVFAHKGFAAARMDDIAKEAGVTTRTIYLYFENKEAVVRSLVREAVATTLTNVAADVQTFDGSARLLIKMVLTRVTQLLVEGERFVLPKIVISESSNRSEERRVGE